MIAENEAALKMQAKNNPKAKDFTTDQFGKVIIMKKFNVNKAPSQESQEVIDAAVSKGTEIEKVNMEKLRQAQSRSGLRRES